MRETPPPAHMFVNLHPADLEDAELYADDGALTPFAKQVVLEITERAALDRIHELSSRVTRLRALGYRIAIDDLGAGYAGLTSFAQLEPEVVKVDMSLVRGIDSSAVKQKLVRSIVALCTELGIQLVAEGIETPAERDMLDQPGRRSLPGLPVRQAGPRLPTPSLDLRLRSAPPSRASRREQRVDLGAGGGEVAVVVDDVRRDAQLLGQRQLGGDAGVGLGLGQPAAREDPGELGRGRGGHDDQAVEVAVAAGLDQQRRLVDGQPVPGGASAASALSPAPGCAGA